ncbi:hypothetical protein E2986_04817 [Frieseomelitta varia]|uniref:Uncharacterized protein n=1 Tax=Frieseomelitta varia TaxID=561572 RepID=A0A833RWK6_9HYME|nr:receptor-interacting serine/threonine-protein kinase 4-like isoform X1 [Frieseomelitta varia]KAF3430748.1 hypothetical protein E2986_04817 [Frieseomelitta varia]
MTAAYTNDLLSKEQNAERKTVIGMIVSKVVHNNNEQTTCEESIEFASGEMTKLATGGREQEKILVNQEQPTVSTSVDASESFEQRVEDTVEYKDVEDTEFPGKSKNISIDTGNNKNTITDTIAEIRNEMLKDSDDSGTPPKSISNSNSNSIASMKDDAIFTEYDSQDTTLGTRETDFPSQSNCENRIFQLRELQDSVNSISTETTNFSNSYKIFNEPLDNNIQKDAEEIYDPESELNFHEAVRAGDAKCVATLLTGESVQNLDEPDWNVSGDPPLLVAATNHCFPILSLLLANGCDPAVRSPRGETALHRVILNGGPGNVLQFVGELLKYGCPSGVKEAGGGLTALHILTRQLAHAQGSKNLHHNFEAALKTLDLLARAGPVNAKDHQGRSALHILASSTIFDNNHRTEIESLIETLLAVGADPSLKNDREETPLHECLECGALNTAFLLIPHTPTGIMSRYGETPLHIASRKNYADMVAKLLEHGEDPSIQDAGGNTPLHLASARGFHQIVSLLVTSPLAQLEKLNVEGLTALQVAAESGFVNAVRLLLKAGADPSQTVHYCTTIFHRHPDISILIDHELSRRRQLAA